MAALGMEPAARPCLIADPVELVLIVNGWVMRAAMAELRVEGEANPRSMVGRGILEHLRGLGVDFEEVYRKTLGWQQGVGAGTSLTARVDQFETELLGEVTRRIAQWVSAEVLPVTLT